MRILILGAGGVGGYFGARLAQAGADVTWLVREKRQALLRERGLRVKSPLGDLTLQPETVTAATVTPDYDLILLAPKAYDLQDSLASLRGALDGRAVLLPLLNGITHLDMLDERFGRERVAGGLAHIIATMEADGTVVQMTPLHNLIFGTRHPAQQTLLAQFEGLCKGAGFNGVFVPQIDEHLWSKWTFLATLAAATTLFRGSIGSIMAADAGHELVTRLYAECLSVAAANGFPIPEQAQATSRGLLLDPASAVTASMYRDLTSGQRTEHEHVLGEMCKKAAAAGLDAPLMRAAWCHMQVEAGGRR